MNQPEAARGDPYAPLKEDPSIGKCLVGYAFKRTHDAAGAEDLAHDAIARVLKGNGFTWWDPSRKALLNHLSDVVVSLLGNESTRAAGWCEVEPNPARDEKKRDSDANIELRALRQKHDNLRQRLADRVLARMDKDPVIPGMLALEQEGIGGARDQADRLGCTEKDIRRARERLAYTATRC